MVGIGGGIDVMLALYHGTASVTGVEINRAMIEAVTERFDAYLEGLFRPDAHPLSESYLYTTEVIHDLYEHVADEGCLSFSRFIMRYPRKPRGRTNGSPAPSTRPTAIGWTAAKVTRNA